MTRFRTHHFGVRMITKKVLNALRTYVLGFWSKLTGNKEFKEPVIECSASPPAKKRWGLAQIKPIKKIRRISNYRFWKHWSSDKVIQKSIKNDYCQKKKKKKTSDRIFRLCKSLL